MDVNSVIKAFSNQTFDLEPENKFIVSFIETFNILRSKMFEYQRYFNTKKIKYTRSIPMSLQVDRQIISSIEDISKLNVDVFNYIFMVKAIDLPDVSIEGRDIDTGNSTFYKVSKIKLNDTFSIEFYSDTLNRALNLYYTWISLMTDAYYNTIRPMYYFESDIKIYRLSRLNEIIDIRTYHGCVPVSTDKIRYDVKQNKYLEGRPINFRINNGITIDKDDGVQTPPQQLVAEVPNMSLRLG